jgi:hypothetical protein
MRTTHTPDLWKLGPNRIAGVSPRIVKQRVFEFPLSRQPTRSRQSFDHEDTRHLRLAVDFANALTGGYIKDS